eukprot:TRINITY_DN69106_c0_g1_i1.p1 TRINITY_DN69106_c0_g1~~TRINITY_DN69106_c0_g1_i1.p1  ORF type:complete len:354 (-),score=27.55 TRINITY_DN69106_c0_g1_i1:129-1136(-)
MTTNTLCVIGIISVLFVRTVHLARLTLNASSSFRNIVSPEYLDERLKHGILYRGIPSGRVDDEAMPKGDYMSTSLLHLDLIKNGTTWFAPCGFVFEPAGALAGSKADAFAPTTQGIWNRCHDMRRRDWDGTKAAGLKELISQSFRRHFVPLYYLFHRDWIALRKNYKLSDIDIDQRIESFVQELQGEDDLRIEYLNAKYSNHPRYSGSWKKVLRVLKDASSECLLTAIFSAVVDAADDILQNESVLQFGPFRKYGLLKPLRKVAEGGPSKLLLKIVEDVRVSDKKPRYTEVVAQPYTKDVVACVTMDDSRPCTFPASQCEGRSFVFTGTGFETLA